MSKRTLTLRALVTERLTAAAEEIFALVERTIAEYEEELCGFKEENQRKQQILDQVLSARVLGPGTEDVAETQVEQFNIKNEPEELSIEQQQGCPSPAELPFTIVRVKNDTEELHEEEEMTSVGNENKTATEDWTQPWEPLTAASLRQSDEEGERHNQNLSTEMTISLPPICRTTYPGGSDDRINMYDLMGKMRRHRCPICGKSLKRDLWRHMLVHTDERPFSCSVCQKGFTRKSSLSLHMRLHLNEKPYHCTICQREFAQKSNFMVHTERHAKAERKQQIQGNRRAGKKLQFLVQEQRLSSEKDDSGQNLEWESSNRKRRRCRNVSEAARTLCLTRQSAPGDRSEECPICGKRFHDLWPHMRLHTGERPYRCTVCRKGFPRRSSLTLHQRLHMQEKPFKCPVCNKEFTQNNNFKRHMAKHEKDGETLRPDTLCPPTQTEPQAGSSAQ